MILTQDDKTGFWNRSPGGLRLMHHDISECVGRLCDVHNRRGSGAQAEWPLLWREDRAIMEVICSHGIGHPTPAQVTFFEERDLSAHAIHGCDGCCHTGNGWPMSKKSLGWTAPTPKKEKTMVKTLYLAGPMTGHAQWNFPAFHAAAKRLRDAGYTVLDPAELDVNEGFNPDTPKEDLTPHMLNDFMHRDLTIIIYEADGVATLPGSSTSKGAQAEVATARAVGKPALSVEAWLDEAKNR